MFKSIKNIHFVGIGGSGMSGIAEVLLKLGFHVSGSDLHKNAEAKRLESLGAVVFEGHRKENIVNADVVVTSTAVPSTNPEVKAAHAAAIPVIPRIEMLAEIARLKYTIAIAGTHGKTTTTSLVGHIFKTVGLDPTVVVGGRLKSVGTGGVLGQGDFLVAEADESDGSFLKLSPTISVVTNIDNDHMDFYKTAARLEDAFVQFSARVPFYGETFLCGDDPGVKKILPRLTRRFSTYGFGPKSTLRAVEVHQDETGSAFTVKQGKATLGRVTIPISGRHNVLNSLAAIAVGMKAGLAFAKIAHALQTFQGVGRRIETKGVSNGVVVLDDYGHHPTEIKATLEAVRSRYSKNRLFVLFQPHRYTRTQALQKDFARVLSKGPHKLYLLPIYAAGEKPIKGISSDSIGRSLTLKNWTAWDDATSMAPLLGEIRPGDVVLTLGAGDVWKRGELLLQRLSSFAAQVRQTLPTLAERFRERENLARHSTWGVGGDADFFAEVHTLDELKNLVRLAAAFKLSVTLLGWGSNVIIPDAGIRGLLLKLRGDFANISFTKTSVLCGAGVHLPKLAKACATAGLAGVEALAGVPGTVGGALMTNAGTPRGTIGSVVYSVYVLGEDGGVQTIPKSDLKFEYRDSNLNGKFVVQTTLALTPASSETLLEKMKAELSSREKTQPLGTKNAGSVFRNPPEDFAARLIDACGLKGTCVGGARVSLKHANFIENTGKATAADIFSLMDLIQKKVEEKFGVKLVREVKVLKPIFQNGALTQ